MEVLSHSVVLSGFELFESLFGACFEIREEEGMGSVVIGSIQWTRRLGCSMVVFGDQTKGKPGTAVVSGSIMEATEYSMLCFSSFDILRRDINRPWVQIPDL